MIWGLLYLATGMFVAGIAEPTGGKTRISAFERVLLVILWPVQVVFSLLKIRGNE